MSSGAGDAEQILALQRLVGNAAVGRLLRADPGLHRAGPDRPAVDVHVGRGGSTRRVSATRVTDPVRPARVAHLQRSPADFARTGELAVWKYKPGWAFRVRSPFEILQESLEAYAKLEVNQTKQRVSALRVVAKDVQRWRDQHQVEVVRREELDEDERNKSDALEELADVIAREWADLGTPDGTLAAPDGPEQILPDPALTKKVSTGEIRIGFFKQAAQILAKDGNQIANVPADTLCHASRKEAPEGGKPVDFWWVEPATPELHHVEIFGNEGKNYGAFPAGYVAASSVTMGARVNARPDLRYSDRSDTRLFPLFPGQPSTDDIRQIGLGDCYLQAALLSIVASDPGYIQSIMHDGGGSVTVQLFDVDPGPPKSFRSRRVTVAKSVVTYARGGEEAFSGGALWVQLLQKAYVAAGFLGGSPETMPVQRGGSYGRIESGNSNIAFEHLTGTPATLDLFSSVAYEHFNIHRTWVTNSGFQRAITGPDLDQITVLAEAEQVPRENDGPIKLLAARIQRWGPVQLAIEDALRKLHDTSTQVRQGDVEELVRRLVPRDLPEYRDRALAWVRVTRIYPGKRGSGVYTEEQDATFSMIKRALDSNHVVAVGTKPKVASAQGGRGASAGEQVAKGLAGPHAYAVIDTATSDELGAELRPNPPLLFVKLRNPWGSYGRIYSVRRPGQGAPPRVTAEADDSKGEFWLLLEDLTKRFDQISIGYVPNPDRESLRALASNPSDRRVTDTSGTADINFTDEDWQ